jgi:hypothetical protein
LRSAAPSLAEEPADFGPVSRTSDAPVAALPGAPNRLEVS